MSSDNMSSHSQSSTYLSTSQVDYIDNSIISVKPAPYFCVDIEMTEGQIKWGPLLVPQRERIWKYLIPRVLIFLFWCLIATLVFLYYLR